MAFHGIFIGVDRYASPRIPWLSCAVRDSSALHALFTDTFGGGAVLLHDAAATKVDVEASLTALETCSADDLVVIVYSGHGTDTHELVLYDTDWARIPETTLPLADLVARISRIPSRRLVCVLDCCFSGGAGAKVFETGSGVKSIDSVDSLLDQMGGEGKFIIAASKADQPALEDRRLRHGLLTYSLLQALKGAPEVVRDGSISTYALVGYLTARVIDAARALGRTQEPAFRGKIDGDLLWPVMTPGAAYHAAFPDIAPLVATSELRSLGTRIDPAILTVVSSVIPSLNELQLAAINDFGILDGQHLVVVAPTSSGKTLIGELAALRAAGQRQRTIFLMPLKALVNDKYRAFSSTYGAYGLRIVRATGESTDDVPDVLRGRYDICLMTYEKFGALVLTAPHLLEQVGVVVVDEVQMLADLHRGANLEFILTLLRSRRAQGIEPQVVALSAVIGDTSGLERWLGGRLLRRDQRPVPLEEGVLNAAGTFRFIDTATRTEETIRNLVMQEMTGKSSSQTLVIPLVRKLVAEGKQVIVFRETRGEARGCALYLARNLSLAPADGALAALPKGDPSSASRALRDSLQGGVAIHIADLDRDERRVVEEEFRRLNSGIRVIVATTTLAMGVNTPAEAVVIVGLEHPGDAQPTPYSVAEYKNLVGRAGRLGIKEKGASYIVVMTPRDEQEVWTRYVTATPENITSRFFAANTDLRSFVVRLLISLERGNPAGSSQTEISDFITNSFGAFIAYAGQAQGRLTESVRTAISSLEQNQLILRDSSGLYRLTQLGHLAGRGGTEVETIVRVAAALRGLNATAITDPVLIVLGQFSVELDQVYFPINKKSTIKEPQSWRDELARQGIPASLVQNLRNGVDIETGTRRMKKAIACLLWISSLSIEDVETTMNKHGGLDGAAGPVRGASSRTHDVIPVVARLAEIFYPTLDLELRMKRLLARLEVGAPSAMGSLAELLGARLTRSDYRALLLAGVTEVQTLSDLDDESLGEVLQADAFKIHEVREVVRQYLAQELEDNPVLPELPLYEA